MVDVRQVILPGFDPLQFFSKLSPRERTPAFLTSGKWVIITWNPTSSSVWKSKADWEGLRKVINKRKKTYRGALPFIGGAIGFLSYEAGQQLLGVKSQHHQREPLAAFHFYENALLWDGASAFIVGDDGFVKAVTAIHQRPFQAPTIPPIQFRPSITQRQYARAFAAVKQAIRAGDVYQLNQTYQFAAQSPVDHRSLFTSLAKSHPAPCAGYLETPDLSIVSLSPERFVSVQGRHIVTCPIKGTRQRGSTPAEDRRMRLELIKSEKEAAELTMIVDVLRNDLGQLAATGTVQVTGHRIVTATPSVWHTHSVIEAELRPEIDRIDVLRAMLPGGSVTGCPKVRAVEIIDEIEADARGPYTGTMLMLPDHGALESSILIRTIVARGQSLSLGVGGGIVADSQLKAEFDETLRKAAPFLALESTERCVFIAGREVLPSDLRCQLLDPANPKARGVFETMRVIDGQVLHLAAHLKRLERSAFITGFTLPVTIKRLRQQIQNAVRSFGHSPARVKVVATKRDVVIGIDRLILDAREPHGVAATFIHLERRIPGAKALPYHREYQAHQTAINRGFHEALLVDHRGLVPEGAYSNIFWVEYGILYTPKDGMLPGVTRAQILKRARALNIPISFKTPTKRQLLNADEVFITRSTAGITPILKIDKTLIGSGKIGSITQKIL